MTTTKCIAFHSYKGGTGKTTLACNFAALLAKKGYRVCLLDMDVYAPSIQAYFEIEPTNWLNNYLNSNASVEDTMIDLTNFIEEKENVIDNTTAYKTSAPLKGKLWVGFSNSLKEEVFKLEGSGGDSSSNRKQSLRRFILLRERLVSDFNADYIIIDTSPGIRYWSINSLALADILLLTLKMGNLDINGTKRITYDIYDSFKKYGAKTFLLCNRVAGYCVPHTYTLTKNTKNMIEIQKQDEIGITDTLSKEIGMKIISSIPCYCDIQFIRKEFLSVLKYPEHPFTKKIEHLVELL